MLSYSSSFTYAPISAIYPTIQNMSQKCSMIHSQIMRGSYLLDIDHDIAIHLGILLLVEPAIR